MKTYQDTITWAAEQAWLKWLQGEIEWQGVVGREANAIAFVFGIPVFQVNKDIWDEVIEIFPHTREL